MALTTYDYDLDGVDETRLSQEILDSAISVVPGEFEGTENTFEASPTANFHVTWANALSGGDKTLLDAVIAAHPAAAPAAAEGDSVVLGTGAVVDPALLPAATETAQGVAEIATQAETNTGTDDVRFVTPAKLAGWSGGPAAGQTLYDAIVPTDYALPSAAFLDGAATVFVRDGGGAGPNGEYIETADIDVPVNGRLEGESPDGAVIDLSGGYSVGADGSGTDYATGTVSITSGTASITGVGVAWQTAGVAVGDFILLGVGDQCWFAIAAIPTETTITLERTYNGQTMAADTYEIKSLRPGISIQNLTLIGNTAGAGLDLTNCMSAHIEDLHVIDCGLAATTPAVLIQDTVDSFFKGVSIAGGAHHGMEINDSNANTFVGLVVVNTAGHGIQVTGGNQDCLFSNYHICSCALNGFNITGGADETLLNGGVLSENTGGGVFMDAGIGDCHVRNTTIRNNGTFGIDAEAGGWSAQNCQISSQTTGYAVIARSGGQINDCMVRGNAGGGLNILGDDVLLDGNRIYSNTGDGITIAVGADRTTLSGNKVFGNSVLNVNDLSTTSIHVDAKRCRFYADQFDSPINADWVVNALAPAAPDSNNNALKVRLFDDTTEEGVGFNLFIPPDTEHLVLTFQSRAETAPGGTVTAIPTLYFREIPDNAAPSATWAGTNDGSQALTAISLPTNENFQSDREVLNLTTLGIVAGSYYQFELTLSGGTLVGDWALRALGVELRV